MADNYLTKLVNQVSGVSSTTDALANTVIFNTSWRDADMDTSRSLYNKEGHPKVVEDKYFLDISNEFLNAAQTGTGRTMVETWLGKNIAETVLHNVLTNVRTGSNGDVRSELKRVQSSVFAALVGAVEEGIVDTAGISNEKAKEFAAEVIFKYIYNDEGNLDDPSSLIRDEEKIYDTDDYIIQTSKIFRRSQITRDGLAINRTIEQVHKGIDALPEVDGLLSRARTEEERSRVIGREAQTESYINRPGVYPFISLLETAKKEIVIDTFQFQNKTISDYLYSVTEKRMLESARSGNWDFELKLRLATPRTGFGAATDEASHTILGPNMLEMQKFNELRIRVINQLKNEVGITPPVGGWDSWEPIKFEAQDRRHHAKLYFTDAVAAIGTTNLTSPMGDNIQQAGSNFETMRFIHNRLGDTDSETLRRSGADSVEARETLLYRQVQDLMTRRYAETDNQPGGRSVSMNRTGDNRANIGLSGDIFSQLEETLGFASRAENDKTKFYAILDQLMLLQYDTDIYAEAAKGEFGAEDELFQSRAAQSGRHTKFKQTQTQLFDLLINNRAEVVVDVRNYRDQILNPTFEKLLKDNGTTLDTIRIEAFKRSGRDIGVFVGEGSTAEKTARLASYGITDSSQVTQLLAIASGNIRATVVARQHVKSFALFDYADGTARAISTYMGSSNLGPYSSSMGLSDDYNVSEEYGVLFSKFGNSKRAGNALTEEQEQEELDASGKHFFITWRQLDTKNIEDPNSSKHRKTTTMWEGQVDSEALATFRERLMEFAANTGIDKNGFSIEYGYDGSNGSGQRVTHLIVSMNVDSMSGMGKGYIAGGGAKSNHNIQFEVTTLKGSSRTGGEGLVYFIGQNRLVSNSVFVNTSGQSIPMPFGSDRGSNDPRPRMLPHGETQQMSSMDTAISLFGTLAGEVIYRTVVSNPRQAFENLSFDEQNRAFTDYLNALAPGGVGIDGLLGSDIKSIAKITQLDGVDRDRHTNKVLDQLTKNQGKLIELVTLIETRFSSQDNKYLQIAAKLGGADIDMTKLDNPRVKAVNKLRESLGNLVTLNKDIENAILANDVPLALAKRDEATRLLAGTENGANISIFSQFRQMMAQVEGETMGAQFPELALDIISQRQDFLYNSRLKKDLQGAGNTLIELLLTPAQDRTYGGPQASYRTLVFGFDASVRYAQARQRAAYNGGGVINKDDIGNLGLYSRMVPYAYGPTTSLGDTYIRSIASKSSINENFEGTAMTFMGLEAMPIGDVMQMEIIEALGMGSITRREHIDLVEARMRSKLALVGMNTTEIEAIIHAMRAKVGVAFGDTINTQTGQIEHAATNTILSFTTGGKEKASQLPQRLKNALGSRPLYALSIEAQKSVDSPRLLAKRLNLSRELREGLISQEQYDSYRLGPAITEDEYKVLLNNNNIPNMRQVADKYLGIGEFKQDSEALKVRVAQEIDRQKTDLIDRYTSGRLKSKTIFEESMARLERGLLTMVTEDLEVAAVFGGRIRKVLDTAAAEWVEEQRREIEEVLGEGSTRDENSIAGEILRAYAIRADMSSQGQGGLIGGPDRGGKKAVVFVQLAGAYSDYAVANPDFGSQYDDNDNLIIQGVNEGGVETTKKRAKGSMLAMGSHEIKNQIAPTPRPTTKTPKTPKGPKVIGGGYAQRFIVNPGVNNTSSTTPPPILPTRESIEATTLTDPAKAHNTSSSSQGVLPDVEPQRSEYPLASSEEESTILPVRTSKYRNKQSRKLNESKSQSVKTVATTEPKSFVTVTTTNTIMGRVRRVYSNIYTTNTSAESNKTNLLDTKQKNLDLESNKSTRENVINYKELQSILNLEKVLTSSNGYYSFPEGNLYRSYLNDFVNTNSDSFELEASTLLNELDEVINFLETQAYGRNGNNEEHGYIRLNFYEQQREIIKEALSKHKQATQNLQQDTTVDNIPPQELVESRVLPNTEFDLTNTTTENRHKLVNYVALSLIPEEVSLTKHPDGSPFTPGTNFDALLKSFTSNKDLDARSMQRDALRLVEELEFVLKEIDVELEYSGSNIYYKKRQASYQAKKTIIQNALIKAGLIEAFEPKDLKPEVISAITDSPTKNSRVVVPFEKLDRSLHHIDTYLVDSDEYIDEDNEKSKKYTSVEDNETLNIDKDISINKRGKFTPVPNSSKQRRNLINYDSLLTLIESTTDTIDGQVFQLGINYKTAVSLFIKGRRMESKQTLIREAFRLVANIDTIVENIDKQLNIVKADYTLYKLRKSYLAQKQIILNSLEPGQDNKTESIVNSVDPFTLITAEPYITELSDPFRITSLEENKPKRGFYNTYDPSDPFSIIPKSKTTRIDSLKPRGKRVSSENSNKVNYLIDTPTLESFQSTVDFELTKHTAIKPARPITGKAYPRNVIEVEVNSSETKPLTRSSSRVKPKEIIKYNTTTSTQNRRNIINYEDLSLFLNDTDSLLLAETNFGFGKQFSNSIDNFLKGRRQESTQSVKKEALTLLVNLEKILKNIEQANSVYPNSYSQYIQHKFYETQYNIIKAGFIKTGLLQLAQEPIFDPNFVLTSTPENVVIPPSKVLNTQELVLDNDVVNRGDYENEYIDNLIQEGVGAEDDGLNRSNFVEELDYIDLTLENSNNKHKRNRKLIRDKARSKSKNIETSQDFGDVITSSDRIKPTESFINSIEFEAGLLPDRRSVINADKLELIYLSPQTRAALSKGQAKGIIGLNEVDILEKRVKTFLSHQTNDVNSVKLDNELPFLPIQDRALRQQEIEFIYAQEVNNKRAGIYKEAIKILDQIDNALVYLNKYPGYDPNGEVRIFYSRYKETIRQALGQHGVNVVEEGTYKSGGRSTYEMTNLLTPSQYIIEDRTQVYNEDIPVVETTIKEVSRDKDYVGIGEKKARWDSPTVDGELTGEGLHGDWDTEDNIRKVKSNLKGATEKGFNPKIIAILEASLIRLEARLAREQTEKATKNSLESVASDSNGGGDNNNNKRTRVGAGEYNDPNQDNNNYIPLTTILAQSKTRTTFKNYTSTTDVIESIEVNEANLDEELASTVKTQGSRNQAEPTLYVAMGDDIRWNSEVGRYMVYRDNKPQMDMLVSRTKQYSVLGGIIENFQVSDGVSVANVEAQAYIREGEDSHSILLNVNRKQGGSPETNQMTWNITRIDVIKAGGGRRSESLVGGLLKAVFTFAAGQNVKLNQADEDGVKRSYFESLVWQMNQRKGGAFSGADLELEQVSAVISPSNIKAFYYSHGSVILRDGDMMDNLFKLDKGGSPSKSSQRMAAALLLSFGSDFASGDPGRGQGLKMQVWEAALRGELGTYYQSVAAVAALQKRGKATEAMKVFFKNASFNAVATPYLTAFSADELENALSGKDSNGDFVTKIKALVELDSADQNKEYINLSDIRQRQSALIVTAIDFYQQFSEGYENKGGVHIATDISFTDGDENNVLKMLATIGGVDKATLDAIATGGLDNKKTQQQLQAMMEGLVSRVPMLRMYMDWASSGSKDPIGSHPKGNLEFQHTLRPMLMQAEAYKAGGQLENLAKVVANVFAAVTSSSSSQFYDLAEDTLPTIVNSQGVRVLKHKNILSEFSRSPFAKARAIGIYGSGSHPEEYRLLQKRYKEIAEASVDKKGNLRKGELLLAMEEPDEQLSNDKVNTLLQELDELTNKLETLSRKYGLEENKAAGSDLAKAVVGAMTHEREVLYIPGLQLRVMPDGNRVLTKSDRGGFMSYLPSGEELNIMGTQFGGYVDQLVKYTEIMLEANSPGTRLAYLLDALARNPEGIVMTPEDEAIIGRYVAAAGDMMSELAKSTSGMRAQGGVGGKTRLDGAVTVPVGNFLVPGDSVVMAEAVLSRAGVEIAGSKQAALLEINYSLDKLYKNIAQVESEIKKGYYQTQEAEANYIVIKEQKLFLQAQREALIEGISEAGTRKLVWGSKKSEEIKAKLLEIKAEPNIDIRLGRLTELRKEVKGWIDFTQSEQKLFNTSSEPGDSFSNLAVQREMELWHSNILVLEDSVNELQGNTDRVMNRSQRLLELERIAVYESNPLMITGYEIGSKYQSQSETNYQVTANLLEGSIRGNMPQASLDFGQVESIGKELPAAKKKERQTEFMLHKVAQALTEFDAAADGITRGLESTWTQEAIKSIDNLKNGLAELELRLKAGANPLDVARDFHALMASEDTRAVQSAVTFRSAPFGSTEFMTQAVRIQRLAAMNQQAAQSGNMSGMLMLQMDEERNRTATFMAPVSKRTIALGDFDGDSFTTIWNYIIETQEQIVRKNDLNFKLRQDITYLEEEKKHLEQDILLNADPIKLSELATVNSKIIQLEQNYTNREAEIIREVKRVKDINDEVTLRAIGAARKDLAEYMGVDERFFIAQAEQDSKGRYGWADKTANVDVLHSYLEFGRNLFGAIDNQAPNIEKSRLALSALVDITKTGAELSTITELDIQTQASTAKATEIALPVADRNTDLIKLLETVESNTDIAKAVAAQVRAFGRREEERELLDPNRDNHTKDLSLRSFTSELHNQLLGNQAYQKLISQGSGMTMTPSTFDILSYSLGVAGGDILGKTFNSMIGTLYQDAPIITMGHVLTKNEHTETAVKAHITKLAQEGKLSQEWINNAGGIAGAAEYFLDQIKSAQAQAEGLQGFMKDTGQLLRDSIKFKDGQGDMLDKLNLVGEEYKRALESGDTESAHKLIIDIAKRIGPGPGLQAYMQLDSLVNLKGIGITNDILLNKFDVDVNSEDYTRIATRLKENGIQPGLDQITINKQVAEYKTRQDLVNLVTAFRFEKSVAAAKSSLNYITEGWDAKLASGETTEDIDTVKSKYQLTEIDPNTNAIIKSTPTTQDTAGVRGNAKYREALASFLGTTVYDEAEYNKRVSEFVKDKGSNALLLFDEVFNKTEKQTQPIFGTEGERLQNFVNQDSTRRSTAQAVGGQMSEAELLRASTRSGDIMDTFMQLMSQGKLNADSLPMLSNMVMAEFEEDIAAGKDVTSRDVVQKLLESRETGATSDEGRAVASMLNELYNLDTGNAKAGDFAYDIDGKTAGYKSMAEFIDEGVEASYMSQQSRMVKHLIESSQEQGNQPFNSYEEIADAAGYTGEARKKFIERMHSMDIQLGQSYRNRDLSYMPNQGATIAKNSVAGHFSQGAIKFLKNAEVANQMDFLLPLLLTVAGNTIASGTIDEDMFQSFAGSSLIALGYSRQGLSTPGYLGALTSKRSILAAGMGTSFKLRMALGETEGDIGEALITMTARELVFNTTTAVIAPKITEAISHRVLGARANSLDQDRYMASKTVASTLAGALISAAMGMMIANTVVNVSQNALIPGIGLIDAALMGASERNQRIRESQLEAEEGIGISIFNDEDGQEVEAGVVVEESYFTDDISNAVRAALSFVNIAEDGEGNTVVDGIPIGSES